MPTAVLEDIDGIGAKTLSLLRTANIDSVQKLADSTVSDLKRIKGIGEKTAIKFIKGARDLLGKPLSSNIIEKTESLEIDKSIIGVIQSNITDIHRKLEDFNRRLEKLESTIGTDTESESEISEDHFFRILKLSYNSLDKKFGGFVLISDLTEKIKNLIPWSTERIHKHLYSLFLNYKIELQPGKMDRGTPLEQDGKKFVWFKLK